VLQRLKIHLAPLDILLVRLLPMRRKAILSNAEGDMLPGTLDMMILRTLILAPAHGHSIAHVIERSSDEVLQVEHGSLYPALHRLEDQGLIAAFWGTSENNRRAKYYRVTPLGRQHLQRERARWEALVAAVSQVLGPVAEEPQ
jgi:transcriptional regulator